MHKDDRKLPTVPAPTELAIVGVHGSVWRHRQAAVGVVCKDQMSKNCRSCLQVPGLIEFVIVGVHWSVWCH
jgi:hypothetical protein